MNEEELRLIGQLQEAAAAGKAEAFRIAVLALMEAYNRAPDEALFSLLHDLLYVPNADAMRVNYERARTALFDRAVRLSEVVSSPQEFPAYEELPCRLFPIDADASVFFLNDGNRFLLHESGARLLDAVQKMLLDAPEAELLPLMADALREQRVIGIRHQLFLWFEHRSFPPQAKELVAEFAALSHDASAPLHIEAALRFAADDLTGARELAERAYALRVANIDLWRLLVDIYDAAGEEERAARFKGLCHKHAGDLPGLALRLEDPAVRRAFCMGRLTPVHAPFYEEVAWSAAGELQTQLRSSAGDFLLQSGGRDRGLWCGLYNTDVFFHVWSTRLACLERTGCRNIDFYSNITFDLRKAVVASSLTIHASHETPVVAAAAPLEEVPPVALSDAEGGGDFYTGKAEFGFLRMESDTRLAASAGKFAAAEPVRLEHGSKRKRLILNLLLDGLSWPAMRRHGFRAMPNLMSFFSKGVIFDQAFSVAEYTFPSLGTVETGLHMHRSQIFHDEVWMELPPEKKTLSERMRALGYCCVQTMGDSSGIYSGYKRGYGRILAAPYITFPAYEGVKRTIDHLDAFDECDNYVFLHVSDSHPVVSYAIPPQPKTQAKLPWQERVYEGTPRERAFDLNGKLRNVYDNMAAIERMDRALGELFRYIEDHYGEDEYIINAYSDHGVSIHSEDPFFFSDERCGTAFMMRGAGVPARGMTDELVSLLDLHAVVMHEAGLPMDETLDANLPAAFGGRAREYVISNSIFPGQTYKLAIRTKEHEFRLETKEFTRMDGTIDMSAYVWHLYEREGHREIWSDALRDKFLAIAWQHVASFAHV
ncbi:sulfatase-like hydrolase/transferase [uncultured Selenomonas sp.]|uniref:sulfatase-like hydrolase/transferase n=1 Tax=uncultured Selenomonas sp. TaxID=159275 RepID=UPI0025DBC309|nr:sulfatase-like hydrolase/transferase [uncultured Selenomonas sp.]